MTNPVGPVPRYLVLNAARRPVSDLEQKLADLRNALVEHRNALATRYETLPLSDPRRVVARHIRAVVGSVHLSWIFLDDQLAEKAWWQHQFNMVPPTAQDDVNDYEVFLAATCVLHPFSLFEAGMRRVVRAMDANACNAGTAEFKSIYEWLLARLRKAGWTFSQGDATKLLDLYRTIRNTLHNNGHYYSPTGQSASLQWRGVTYNFAHGQPPAFIDWEFNIMLVRDLGQLNREVMTAPPVAALPPLA